MTSPVAVDIEELRAAIPMIRMAAARGVLSVGSDELVDDVLLFCSSVVALADELEGLRKRCAELRHGYLVEYCRGEFRCLNCNRTGSPEAHRDDCLAAPGAPDE